MIKLYEITEAYRDLIDLDLDEETFQDALASIEGEIAVKAENIAKLMRTMELEENAYKDEIKRLKAHADSLAKKRESLKNYIDSNLQAMGIDKLQAGTFKFSYRKSTAVKVTDEDAVPDVYKNKVTTKTVNKKLLKEILKDGSEIPGVELEEKQNLQMK